MRVRREDVDHRLGVGVEVEKTAAPRDRCRQVAEIVKLQVAEHVIGVRRQAHHATAVGQTQCSTERAITHLLAAGHCGRAQMAEDTLVGEWCPHG